MIPRPRRRTNPVPSKLKIESAVPCSFLRGWKRRLTVLGKAVLASECEGVYAVEIIVVNDATITDLNTRYLNHPRPTDVIAFPLEEDVSRGIEGEIYISSDTARRQSAEYGVRPVEEFARLLIHGLLHLCRKKPEKTI